MNLEELNQPIIFGAGGKSGGGGGGQEDPDSLQSISRVYIVDLISEGQIEGFITPDGKIITDPEDTDIFKCVYVDETPIKNPNGTNNFSLPELYWALGSATQEPLPLADSIQNVRPVELQVRKDDPTGVSLALSGSDWNEVLVNVRVQPLFKVEKDTGDVVGSAVEYKISLYLDNVLHTTITRKIKGKTRSFFARSHSLKIRQAYTTGFVRVQRITPDPEDIHTANNLYFSSVTEIKSVRLSYPFSALVAMNIDSSQFASIPRRGYRIRGVRVKVPANYYIENRLNPDNVPPNPNNKKLYDDVPGQPGVNGAGVWDGTFKIAWTNNPAWIFYDLITERRYGLGRFIDAALVDKWALYQIAQYSDELVDDGLGGQEPRFVCNTYLQSREEAYEVIRNLASVFRSMVYWANGLITAVQDRDNGTSVALFTRANVVDGRFTYVGTARKARHTVAFVAYNDPADFYRKKVEYVEGDALDIAELGLNPVEMTAFGCVSRGQAHRVGKHAILAEKHMTETVRFSTGLDASFLRPGMIYSVVDPLRSKDRLGGRLVAGTTTQLTLDKAITFDGTKTYTIYLINPASAMTAADQEPQHTALDDMVMSRTITPGTSGLQSVVTLTSALPVAPQKDGIWVIAIEAEIVPQQFKVLGISEDEGNRINVVGLEYVPTMYAAVEQDLPIQELPTFNLPNPNKPEEPKNLVVNSEFDVTPMGLRRKLTASWEHSPDRFISHYVVEVSYGDGNYAVVGTTASSSLTFEVRAATQYSIRVKAVNTLGFSSNYISTVYTLSDRILTDASITGLELFGQGNVTEFTGRDPRFAWRFNSLDTFSEAGDSAQGTRHPLLKGFIVQIINPLNLRVVRQEDVLDATYTYRYEDNVRDNNGVPLRRFTIRVAAVDLTNSLSEAAELTVNNPSPFLGSLPPNIDRDKIRFSTRGGQVVIDYTTPDDTDFDGVLVFISNSPTFSITDITSAGELLPSAMVPYDYKLNTGRLAYRGRDTQIRLDADVLYGKDWRVIVAPYDVFGFTALNYYGPVSTQIELTVDTTPPAVPTLYALRTRSEIKADGSEQVVLAAYFYPSVVGAPATLSSSSWVSVDTDLDVYGLEITELDPADVPLFVPRYESLPARVDNAGYLKVLDAVSGYYLVVKEWVVKPNTRYQVRVSARDTSGNSSAWSAPAILTSARDTSAPSSPTSIATQSSYTTVFLTWVNPTAQDFAKTRIYVNTTNTPPVWNGTRFVFSLGQTSAQAFDTDGTAFAVTGLITDQLYYFWLTAVDSSNNETPILTTPVTATPSLVPGSSIESLAADKITSGTISTAELVLSGNGRIRSSGATAYATGVGFWMAMASGVAQFRFGDPANKMLSWDGTSLTLKGVLKIATDLTLETGTSGAGLYLGADRLGFHNGTSWLAYIQNNGNFRFEGGAEKYLSWNGTAFIVEGELIARAGRIGGLTVTYNEMFFASTGTAAYGTANTQLWLDNTGRFSLKDRFKWDGSNLLAAGFTIAYDAAQDDVTVPKGKIHFGTGTFANANTAFYADTLGRFSLKDKFHFDGSSVTAANFKITFDSTQDDVTTPKGKIYFGTGVYANVNTAFYADTMGRFSLKNKLTFDGTNLALEGSLTAGGGNFIVDASGNLTALSVVAIGLPGNAVSGSETRSVPRSVPLIPAGSNFILKSITRNLNTGYFAEIFWYIGMTHDADPTLVTFPYIRVFLEYSSNGGSSWNYILLDARDSVEVNKNQNAFTNPDAILRVFVSQGTFMFVPPTTGSYILRLRQAMAGVNAGAAFDAIFNPCMFSVAQARLV